MPQTGPACLAVNYRPVLFRSSSHDDAKWCRDWRYICRNGLDDAATGEITGLGLSHQAIIMTVMVVVILAGVDYMERKVLSLQKVAKAT